MLRCLTFRQFLALFILLSCTWYAQSQVMINEFSAANYNAIPDNYGEYEDWIELYNAGATSVDLG